ncbi:MAG: ATP synthase F1 subunit delta [Acidimicrobiales bacterium]|nr:ATP synthase F1 subunit delta [Acidimicrobiales bacterium]HLV91013.1 ATP synthase F1 subunit delta [Acidimicrobiia bacterium]
MSERIAGIAAGIYEMARAEGEVERLESELAAVARAMESSDELRSTLTDPQLPLERKQGVLEELIGGRASRLTRSVLHLIVGLDRASELPQIVRSLMETAAASRSKTLAEVRSAVPLDDATVNRLAAALTKATGKDVEVRVVVDPSVVGGLVARVGDTVIDGSIAKKVASLRQLVTSR